MKKRTWHYIESPALFGLCCEKCKDENIYWSEYENHIWCFKCEKDIWYETSIEIFPMGIADLLGVTFGKFDLVNQKRLYYRDGKWEG